MSRKQFIVGEKDICLLDIRFFLEENPEVILHEDVKEKIIKSRKIIDDIVNSSKTVYGVNTGFGKFADVPIERAETAELQRRLVLSHAAGVGNPMPIDIVKLMMLLKIKNLSQGFSGVRLELVQLLIDILNNDIVPFVPEKGSVGASGDLAPLAHIALTMIGEGDAYIRKNGLYHLTSAKEALRRNGLNPLAFEAKEGLAVLNGTQAMQAQGIWAINQARKLVKSADIIGAMTLEALLGTLTAFDDRIQKVRNHPGQVDVGENFRKILDKSPIVESHRYSDNKVQDAYSLRCSPQVHGAVRDALDYIESVFIREINGVTDNPLVFPDNGDVLSGGNFHGEPLALSADYLGIVMAELANISERRIEHMLDPAVSEMAGFLTEKGGLNSGFMIAQVTAAALVSENKVLAHPSSVDSIPTSANKEDHVSMGTFAARKAMEIVKNVENVYAVELICACQSLELRKPLEPSITTSAILKLVRSKIAHWDEDRIMYKDINAANNLISSGEIIKQAEEKCGCLN